MWQMYSPPWVIPTLKTSLYWHSIHMACEPEGKWSGVKLITFSAE